MRTSQRVHQHGRPSVQTCALPMLALASIWEVFTVSHYTTVLEVRAVVHGH
eukprot:COSAG02_NODE_4788_length_4976_cov_6.285421_5_plen_51_part_00